MIFFDIRICTYSNVLKYLSLRHNVFKLCWDSASHWMAPVSIYFAGIALQDWNETQVALTTLIWFVGYFDVIWKSESGHWPARSFAWSYWTRGHGCEDLCAVQQEKFGFHSESCLDLAELIGTVSVQLTLRSCMALLMPREDIAAHHCAGPVFWAGTGLLTTEHVIILKVKHIKIDYSWSLKPWLMCAWLQS